MIYTFLFYNIRLLLCFSLILDVFVINLRCSKILKRRKMKKFEFEEVFAQKISHKVFSLKLQQTQYKCQSTPLLLQVLSM